MKTFKVETSQFFMFCKYLFLKKLILFAALNMSAESVYSHIAT